MNFTFDSQKGRRAYQEDTLVCAAIPAGHIFGIFDGHGGEEVSAFCCDHLVDYWNDTLPTLTPIQRLRKLVSKLHKNTADLYAGSTASIVVANDQVAYCAVIGDSPIISKNAKGKVRISPEHNVRTNRKEVLAAEKRGGWIRNGYLFASLDGQGLQMSRALGDSDLRRVLSRRPQTYTVNVAPGSWMLIGSDGILDPGHANHDITPLVDGIEKASFTAKDIVDRAIQLPTHDNASAILIRW